MNIICYSLFMHKILAIGVQLQYHIFLGKNTYPKEVNTTKKVNTNNVNKSIKRYKPEHFCNLNRMQILFLIEKKSPNSRHD